jgi:hypothetical protein
MVAEGRVGNSIGLLDLSQWDLRARDRPPCLATVRRHGGIGSRAPAPAIQIEPTREENKRLTLLVNDVESRARPCPRNEAEVAKALG